MRGELVLPSTAADRSAIVLVHEVFGLTDAVADIADRMRTATGVSVYAPHLLSTDPYPRAAEGVAYEQFMATLGPRGLAERLLTYASRRAEDHEALYCAGFSVGATAAWIASADECFDAVLPIYGSRIRDHIDVRPTGRAHLVFAEHEPSFDPHSLAAVLRQTADVTVDVLPHHHGFCSPDSPAYSTTGLETVHATARALIHGITPTAVPTR